MKPKVGETYTSYKEVKVQSYEGIISFQITEYIKTLVLYHEDVAFNPNAKYKMGFYGRMPHIFAKLCDGSKCIRRGGNHGNDIVCNEFF